MSVFRQTKVTDEDFRQIIAGELKGEWLQQELSRDLMVEASDAQAFYDKEKANPNYAALFRCNLCSSAVTAGSS